MSANTITLHGKEALKGGFLPTVKPRFAGDTMTLVAFSVMVSRYHAIVYCDPGTTPGGQIIQPPPLVGPGGLPGRPLIGPGGLPWSLPGPPEIEEYGSPEYYERHRRRAGQGLRERGFGEYKSLPRECMKYEIWFSMRTAKLWAADYAKVTSEEPQGDFTWAEYITGLSFAFTLLSPALQALLGPMTGAATTIPGGIAVMSAQAALQSVLTTMISGQFPTGRTPSDQVLAAQAFIGLVLSPLQSTGGVVFGLPGAPRDPEGRKARFIWQLEAFRMLAASTAPFDVEIKGTEVPCPTNMAMGSPSVCASLADGALPPELVPPPPDPPEPVTGIPPGSWGKMRPVDEGLSIPKNIG